MPQRDGVRSLRGWSEMTNLDPKMVCSRWIVLFEDHQLLTNTLGTYSSSHFSSLMSTKQGSAGKMVGSSLVKDLHDETPGGLNAQEGAKQQAPKTPSKDEENKEANQHSTKSADKTSTAKKKRRASIGTAKSLNKTYEQLIHEAIVALKDRTGSSQPAISKWIMATYPAFEDGPTYRRNLNSSLKNGVKKEHFAKVKASYKISAKFKEKERSKKRKAAAAAAAAKKKVIQEQQSAVKQLEKTQAVNAKKAKELETKKLSPEEIEKIKAEMAKKEVLARRRAEAEARAKERADRLRRRRFPMEDTKLHAEDKELSVKPPVDVVARPYLPYFWHSILPFGDPARSGKTSSSILQASKVDGLDSGSHGLVPDLLQVYHFFRGDVHFTSPNDDEYYPIAPEFSLKQLMFSVDQILNGNARKARLVPPLICHLFVTCLQILCSPPDRSIEDKNELKLRRELHENLAPALSPASWAEVCCLYMDAMDRYYSTDSSRDPNVLPGLAIDIEYLLGVSDNPVVPMTPSLQKSNNGQDENVSELPDRYYSYIGNPKGVLYRAQAKLLRQDPWTLTAEELIALLRALTDDILSTNPAISEDLAAREEKMHELLRAKRSADFKFRKVRVAFEGPKKPTKKPVVDEKAVETATEDNKNETKAEGNTNGKIVDTPFKPTATKKQFETAKRAQQRASEAYEKGIRSLVARTEPVGYDRNYNAVYCFRHDPENLYVEDKRPSMGTVSSLPAEFQFERRSWHVIETSSLFDTFTSSLDIRGKRENDLYEALLGPPGSHQSLRRFLHDDLKEQAAAAAKLKEMEALKERLKVARLKCDEEQGRRSGRLAGQAELELSEIEEEMNKLEMKLSGEKVEVVECDYSELTGLELLRKFEKAGQLDKRRTREVKVSKARYLPLMNCTDLCSSGNIDGTGIVGMLVSDLLEVEELCESLMPWDSKSQSRAAWISRLESAVQAWNSISPDLLGPPDTPRKSLPLAGDLDSPSTSGRDALSSPPSSKRRRVDIPSMSDQNLYSVSSIITLLKQPLLDLETRVADITNLAVASRDVDMADDNMSTDGADDDAAERAKLEIAWKRLVHKLRGAPTKRHVQIRDLLVAAITAARKAHLPEVVAKLRAALLLYHPGAAGECKLAATKVLVDYGDYDEEDDESSDDQEDEKEETDDDDEIPSVISLEAAVLRYSDISSRGEWIDSVKSVKTISRLAALCNTFCRNAKEKLEKISLERKALESALVVWEKEDDRRSRKGGKPRSSEYEGPSEVWANVDFTDEIIMARVEEYPWWPAKKCIPKDPATAESLSKLNRSLVSLIGEKGGLRVGKDNEIRPFAGKQIEEPAENISRDIRSQLNDCVAMARRILRGTK